MAKHDSNDDRHDSKSALSKAGHTVSPGKRSDMTAPRGGSAGRPSIKIPGEAVMKEAEEGETGFKRGGKIKGKGSLPKVAGKAHSMGPVRPFMTETPPESLNAADGSKRGGKAHHKKDGGEACDDGMAAKRMDRPHRKARGGATTMRGRSPLSSAATTEMPSRANTH